MEKERKLLKYTGSATWYTDVRLGDRLDRASPFSNHCCERGGGRGWHSRERVVSNLLAIKAGLPGPLRGPVLLAG